MRGLLLIALIFFVARSGKGSGIHGMSKTSFVKPYTEAGKTTLRGSQGQSGVYLIKEDAREIVYVGHSKSNLYRTLYRHFQSWDDPQQYRATYSNRNNYTVRIIYTTPPQAERLEKYLVNRYKPRDNEQKLKQYQGEGKKEYVKYQEAEEENPF